MKLRVPNYFNEFECIASKCEDTCCAGWEIVIDDESYERYMKVDGDFGDALRSKIGKSDGDNVFLLNNGNCSFLNESKMCEIYINIGEEHLCYTCKQFPRYTEEFGDLREVGLSLSCPEAARIILRNPKNITFELGDLEEEENLSSSENGSAFEDENFEDDFNDYDFGIDEDVLEDFLECRNLIFDIINKKNLDLGSRMSLVLKFIKDVQNKIDLGDMNEIGEVIFDYRDEKVLEEIMGEILEVKNEWSKKYTMLSEYFKVYKRIKHINHNDPLGLDNGLRYLEGNEELSFNKHKEFNKYYKENSYKFENIFVYFIFRYFMKGIFDYDLSAKIKLAIISTLMIKELSIVRFMDKGEFKEEDMVEVSRIYSKDIEHSDENVENLQEIFETNQLFEVQEVLIMLMNEF